MTSSAMSTSPEFGRCLSSAILLSSSAIGFSKSRYVVIEFQMSPGTGILSTGRPASAAGQRMLVLHQRSQLFWNDMGVNLGRRDVCMAQHELHATQIGAGLQQMTGEGVAQHVRRDARGIDASGQRRFLQELGKTLTCEMPGSATRRKEIARGLILAECGC